MPELPDVVVYIEALETRILGQKLESVRVVSPFLLRTVDPPRRQLASELREAATRAPHQHRGAGAHDWPDADAGTHAERVDLGARKLVFRRAVPRSASPARPQSTPPPRPGILETLRRKLGGTVRMQPGFDPAAPTGERWDAEA